MPVVSMGMGNDAGHSLLQQVRSALLLRDSQLQTLLFRLSVCGRTNLAQICCYVRKSHRVLSDGTLRRHVLTVCRFCRQMHVQPPPPLGLSVAPSAIGIGGVPLPHPLSVSRTVLQQQQPAQQPQQQPQQVSVGTVRVSSSVGAGRGRRGGGRGAEPGHAGGAGAAAGSAGGGRASPALMAL